MPAMAELGSLLLGHPNCAMKLPREAGVNKSYSVSMRAAMSAWVDGGGGGGGHELGDDAVESEAIVVPALGQVDKVRRGDCNMRERGPMSSEHTNSTRKA